MQGKLIIETRTNYEKGKDIYWIGIITCLLGACSNNDTSIEIELPDETEQEETWIQLRIQDSSFSTYASTSEEYPNTSREKVAINYPIDLYIFNSAGIFDQHLQLPLTQTDTWHYTTDPFQYITGQAYFYAFANALPGQIPEPTTGMDRISFEKSTFNYHPDSLYLGSRGLVMGTLVGVSTLIGMASSSSPETIYLPIGRIVSKVMMVSNDPEVKGDLKGDIYYTSSYRPGYEIINKAQNVYLVGQWKGPFKQLGSQVISPHFYGYTSADIDPNYKYPSIGGDVYTYTIENTNQVPTTSNATAFHIRYTYIPDASELYDVNNPDQPGATQDAYRNLWVAVFGNGEWLMYNGDPTNITHPTLGQPVEVTYYQYGMMYYRVPIADMTEKPPVCGMLLSETITMHLRSNPSQHWAVPTGTKIFRKWS